LSGTRSAKTGTKLATRLGRWASLLALTLARPAPGADATNVMFSAITPADGDVALTVSYPPGFTNRLEIYESPDLRTPHWRLAASNLVTVGQPAVTWRAAHTDDRRSRFFTAADADLDRDGDMLPDARELFVYHTSPTNGDTDADGLLDGEEIKEHRTDPRNGDRDKPVVVLTSPTNGYRWVWIP
jgi:hypothetical protein